MTQIPECFRVGNGSMTEWSETSAFWIFNQMSNWAYTKYDYIHPEIDKMQHQLEGNWVNTLVPEIDNRANGCKNQKEAIRQLTEFSCTQADKLCMTWKNFYHTLFMKYMDGNVKTAREVPEGYKYYAPKVEQPKYDEDFYKVIIDQTGDKLKVY